MARFDRPTMLCACALLGVGLTVAETSHGQPRRPARPDAGAPAPAPAVDDAAQATEAERRAARAREQQARRAATAHPAPAASPSATDRARADRRAAVMQPPTPAPTPPSASSGLPSTDQGLLNDMHRSHVGQVVFTREDLTVHAIQPSSLADSFALGEPMYFRVYMARSAVNAVFGRPGVSADRQEVAVGIRYRARFEVDGRPIDTSFHPFGEITERNTYTTWRGKLLDPGPSYAALPGTEVLRELVARGSQMGLFAAGSSHRVTMRIVVLVVPPEGQGDTPIVGPEVAAGQFTLRVPAGVVSPDNASVCVPAGPRDPAVEAAVFEQGRRAWLPRDATPVTARVSQTPWQVDRHPVTGIPLQRSTDVYVVGRGADACYALPYTWTEPFAGNGFDTRSGELSFRPTVRVYLPCSCLEGAR